MRHWRRFAIAMLALTFAAGVAACGDDDDNGDDGAADTTAPAETTAPEAGGPLVGLFGVDAAVCTDGAPTAGSYFRMVQSGGTLADGPFVENADSTCGDKTYSGFEPGTDGGLVTGEFQPQPDPPFDATMNGLADAVIQPVKFFAVGFAISTNETDPQSSEAVEAPSIEADADGALSGDVSAVSVAWNGQQFNQGVPKPDGSMPGNTTELSGTYDAETGAYEMEWASTIIGGPFDGFTGVWHLEGTFEPAS